LRKNQQKQILDVLGTLREAQEAELYADCQDGAIGIGEYIEELVGEGTETVSLLEEYCELIYRASIEEAGSNALKKQLLKIENSVKNELKPTKTEVVFLTYKASMSDCLESIYMAAKENPNCDVYWMPIPYYEKKPDGKFSTMHIEGPEFYKDSVECTDWKEYDIAERCPDAIFSYAPYDEQNYTTSVHPNYFFRTMRKQTICWYMYRIS